VKPSEFAELVESIRRSNGNDRPIEVRLIRGPGDASFEIIAGHRRFRALQLLNQESREAHEADPEKHPYIRFGQAYVAVVDVDDEAADRRHEEENAKRSAKRPFSLAMQLSAMMRSGRYATQEELARNISRDPGDVSLYLKLLDKAPHDLWGRVKDPASLKQSDAKAIVKAYDKPAFADWVKRLDRTGVTPLSTVLKKAKEVCARPKAEKDVVNQVREVKRGDTYHIALPKNLDATVRQDLLKAVRDKLAESGLG
jgi:ParB-like chromosome segregation protein Spo0J